MPRRWMPRFAAVPRSYRSGRRTRAAAPSCSRWALQSGSSVLPFPVQGSRHASEKAKGSVVVGSVARGYIRAPRPILQLHVSETSLCLLMGSVRAPQVQQVMDVCRPAGVPVIVNDRIDIALAAGAAGVHVGQVGSNARTSTSNGPW